jgi:hypothetical protein
MLIGERFVWDENTPQTYLSPISLSGFRSQEDNPGSQLQTKEDVYSSAGVQLKEQPEVRAEEEISPMTGVQSLDDQLELRAEEEISPMTGVQPLKRQSELQTGEGISPMTGVQPLEVQPEADEEISPMTGVQPLEKQSELQAEEEIPPMIVVQFLEEQPELQVDEEIPPMTGVQPLEKQSELQVEEEIPPTIDVQSQLRDGSKHWRLLRRSDLGRYEIRKVPGKIRRVLVQPTWVGKCSPRKFLNEQSKYDVFRFLSYASRVQPSGEVDFVRDFCENPHFARPQFLDSGRVRPVQRALVNVESGR